MATSTDARGVPDASPTAPFARTLLDLFSPATAHAPEPGAAAATGHPALWADDAVHRAANLAQMAASLGSPGLRALHGGDGGDRAAQAGALALAYGALGTTEDHDRPVPCAPLLRVIAAGLVGLFGAERSIGVEILADDVALPGEQRRALLLIASELVINALKYAFLPDQPGVIAVTLRRRGARLELTVADTGNGLPEDHARHGSGARLMGRLAALLGSTIRRYSTPDGLSVVLTMPRPLIPRPS